MPNRPTLGQWIDEKMPRFGLSAISVKKKVTELLKNHPNLFPLTSKSNLPRIFVEETRVTCARGKLEAILSLIVGHEKAQVPLKVTQNSGAEGFMTPTLTAELNNGPSIDLEVKGIRSIRERVMAIFKYVQSPQFKSGNSKELAAHFFAEPGIIEALVVKAVQPQLPVDDTSVTLLYELVPREEAGHQNLKAFINLAIGQRVNRFALNAPVTHNVGRRELVLVDASAQEELMRASVPSISNGVKKEPANDRFWQTHQTLNDLAKNFPVLQPQSLFIHALIRTGWLPADKCPLEYRMIGRQYIAKPEEQSVRRAVLTIKSEPVIEIDITFDVPTKTLTLEKGEAKQVFDLVALKSALKKARVAQMVETKQENVAEAPNHKESPTEFKALEPCLGELASLHGVDADEIRKTMMALELRANGKAYSFGDVCKAATAIKLKYTQSPEDPIQERSTRGTLVEFTFPNVRSSLKITVRSSFNQVSNKREATLTLHNARSVFKAIVRTVRSA